MINATTTIITTVVGIRSVGGIYAGDGGLALSASLNKPAGLTFDMYGNLFFSDLGNNVIRRVDAVSKRISTVVGNYSSGGSFNPAQNGGPAQSISLSSPDGIVFDPTSGDLYIADDGNNVVWRATNLF